MVFLITAILCSASMALALKYFGGQSGNRYGIILGNYITCVLIAFLAMPEKRMLLSLSRTTVVCGLICGALFVAGLVTIQLSIPVNGTTLSAAFARLGLVVSLAASIALFGERPGAFQIAGIVLVLAALVLINSGKEKLNTDIASPGLLLLTMLAGGLADTMAKIFERVGSREEDTAYFFVLFCTALVITSGLAYSEYRRSGKKLILREMLAGAAVGVPNYFSSYLLLQALVSLPAFFVYPVFSTGTILVVLFCSALLFKERPGSRQLAGIGVILAALALLNL